AYRDAIGGEMCFGFADTEDAEVKDRGGEYRGGVTVTDAFDEVVEAADPARGDDRHPHRIGDRPGQRDVKAGFGAVAVHRGQQDLAGAVIDEPAGPFDRVEPGRLSSAMGEDPPSARS